MTEAVRVVPIAESLSTFTHDTIEELKAKVAARVPLSLSVEQGKELLLLLDPPVVDPSMGPDDPNRVVHVQNELGERDGTVAVVTGARADTEGVPLGPLDHGTFSSDVSSRGLPVPFAPTLRDGALPPNFPSRSALSAATINTFDQARRQRDSPEGLKGVPGIGDAAAAKIEEALK